MDTKNILRVVALLPDNVIKRQKRVQEAGVLSNTVIMHVDGYFSRATLTAHRPKYENGTMDIYYSLQNASDEDVEDGVITMRTALQNSFKGKQPTVSRYTFNWYHN